jgi:hypothetical protein
MRVARGSRKEDEPIAPERRDVRHSIGAVFFHKEFH